MNTLFEFELSSSLQEWRQRGGRRHIMCLVFGLFNRCEGGQAHHFHCPTGLVFQPSLSVCDWGNKVDCQDGHRPSRSNPDTSGQPANTTTTTASPTTAATTQSPAATTPQATTTASSATGTTTAVTTTTAATTPERPKTTTTATIAAAERAT